MGVFSWIIPVMVTSVLLVGYIKGINVYETFVEGVQEGLQLVVRILPYLMAMYIAVAVFQYSGTLELVGRITGPVLRALGMPVEIVPLVLVRPLSGAASTGIVLHILQESGPDSLAGRMASILQASSETTFYVLTLYLGSVGIKKSRYAIPVCLLGDVAGFIAAVVITRLFF
ncbi:MAG: spore maturation protein [Bacillota bacterium]